jgi:hypothetical protein
MPIEVCIEFLSVKVENNFFLTQCHVLNVLFLAIESLDNFIKDMHKILPNLARYQGYIQYDVVRSINEKRMR